MRLRKIRIINFRGYSDEEIDIHKNINVIIGKNDVGKSTIIDAMNIFFNDEVKPEISDCKIDSEDMEFEIICCFEIDDEELIVLDASNPTTLKDEYLLNKEGLLEVRKSYNASGKSITKGSLSVSINSYYPVIEEDALITFKVTKLKKVLEKYKKDIPNYEDINKTKKADMRIALFKKMVTEDTEFKEEYIDIKKIEDENLKTWEKLKKELPLFTLFQSDRTNTDEDKEVQDPMKAITKKVLADMEPELKEIEDKVVEKVEEIGKDTIEKLKDFDEDIATKLKTIPDLKNWDTMFRFNLDTDDDIPLNKRGSGIRRLILLSYFRAQAEKDANELGKKDIIYAIEEPETSQHPDYQTMIIESLTKISEKFNHQIILTTHTPEIVKMVEKESVILVKKDKLNIPYVTTNEDIRHKEIIDTLGILPTINAKVVICVEGKYDICFLKTINNVVSDFRDIVDLNSDDIRIFEVGGNKLIDWINNNHFRDSGIKEFHIYDSDLPKYVEKVKELNNLNDGRRTGVVTKRLEMENYIPAELIEDKFDCDLSEYKDNWCRFDIPEYLKQSKMLQIEEIDRRENAIKGIINKNLTKQVTSENLKEHGVYDEIYSWFEMIRGFLE